MNAIYIYFAYIVATYLVGSELSRFYCLALTVMYSVFLTLPVLSFLFQISLLEVNAQQSQAAYPELIEAYSTHRPIVPPTYFYNVGIGIWVSAWLTSLVFMLSKRYSTQGST